MVALRGIYPKMSPQDSNASSPLSKRFVSLFARGHVVRSIELALANARIASRERADIGARETRIDIEGDVSVVVAVLGSFHSEVVISAPREAHQRFGVVIAALRGIAKLREQATKPAAKLPGRPRVSRPLAAGFARQLARLGITPLLPVNTLGEFLRELAKHPFGRLEFGAPARVLRQADDCVFHDLVLIATRVVDIVERVLGGCPRCGYLGQFSCLQGFRPNLSETQLTRFREDYTVTYRDKSHLGRLHLTLGTGHSKSRCASIHWALDGNLLVLTRIGAHGRNAQS